VSGDLTAGFRSGLENVIIFWRRRIRWVKKPLVLLISQKDYEHIKKYEVWVGDSELRNWNWVNVACLTEILQVKCVSGFSGGI